MEAAEFFRKEYELNYMIATLGRPHVSLINGVVMEAGAREFSTGSLGWYSSATIAVSVGGTPVDVQIGLNMTVAGSKDLPKKRK